MPKHAEFLLINLFQKQARQFIRIATQEFIIKAAINLTDSVPDLSVR